MSALMLQTHPPNPKPRPCLQAVAGAAGAQKTFEEKCFFYLQPPPPNLGGDTHETSGEKGLEGRKGHDGCELARTRMEERADADRALGEWEGGGRKILLRRLGDVDAAIVDSSWKYSAPGVGLRVES